MNSIQKFTYPNTNTDVVSLEYAGQPMFVLNHVAIAIGYTHTRNLTKKVRGEWADEFDAGDVVRLKGKELKGLREVLSVPCHTPTLTIISEAAIYKISMLSRAVKARAFRDWLAYEVLPSIRATGQYTRGSTSLVPE